MATNFKKQLYANNATSTLAYSIDALATIISLVDGSAFPDPVEGQYFSLTLGSGADTEIVEVYGRSGNSLTDCIRGAQGTTAKSFGAGALAENRLTADSIQSMVREQDRLAPVQSLLLLEKPELLNNNSCLLEDTDDAGNPIVAFEYSGRWRFSTHPITLVDQDIFDVVTQVTSTSMLYSSSTDLGSIFVNKGLIVQAVSGLNRGQARYVTSATSDAISWATPFPYDFSYGDRLQVYQSASSAIAWLTGQIAAVSGGQSTQQSLIQEEIYKTAYKSPVTVATTADVSLTGLPLIDGVQVQIGNRVLVKNQAIPQQNGIYVAASGGWSRAVDANSNEKVRANMLVPVIGGNTQADSVWILDVPGAVVLGTTALPFKNLNFLYATINSPSLTGVPTAPTAAVNTSNGQIATTAFVVNQGSSSTPLMNGVGAAGASKQLSRADHVHPSDTSRASVASPTFTGTPSAPTPAQFDSTTKVATTEFVQRAVGNYATAVVRAGATEYVSESDMGKVLILTNALSVYLPKIGGIPNGASVTLRAETTLCVTINRAAEDNGDWVSLDPRYTAEGPLYSKLYLMPGESITLSLYKTGASGGYPTLSARWAATAGDLVGQPSPGAIVHFATSYAPFGFIPADGIPRSRTQYARLFSVIGTTWGAGNGSTTFQVPDMRGEFLRGWDFGRGVDPGRGLGTFQNDAIRSHQHGTSWQLSNEGGSVWDSIGSGSNNLEAAYFTKPTNYFGDVETRPRNVAMLACIKY